jgi:hypothetical protein
MLQAPQRTAKVVDAFVTQKAYFSSFIGIGESECREKAHSGAK